MARRRKTFSIIPLFFAISVVLSGSLMLYMVSISKSMHFGATFSPRYAEFLGLDWQEAYTNTLDQLPLEHMRIPVEWSTHEPVQGEYHFDEIDWIMDESARVGVPVTLAIGQKVPRWPECFIPDWVESENEFVRQEALSVFLETVVLRYKDHEALERWQVENEPFFPFGECPTISWEHVKQEIELVKSLDPEHHIVATASGEQSFWPLRTLDVDVLGVSMYRVVKNQALGIFVFPYRPSFYRAQKILTSPFIQEVMISELQAEPWGAPELYIEGNMDAAYGAFTVSDLVRHVDYARRSGMNELHFWGIEWWYFLAKNGKPELWIAARDIIEVYGR